MVPVTTASGRIIHPRTGSCTLVTWQATDGSSTNSSAMSTSSGIRRKSTSRQVRWRSHGRAGPARARQTSGPSRATAGRRPVGRATEPNTAPPAATGRPKMPQLAGSRRKNSQRWLAAAGWQAGSPGRTASLGLQGPRHRPVGWYSRNAVAESPHGCGLSPEPEGRASDGCRPGRKAQRSGRHQTDGGGPVYDEVSDRGTFAQTKIRSWPYRSEPHTV